MYEPHCVSGFHYVLFPVSQCRTTALGDEMLTFSQTCSQHSSAAPPSVLGEPRASSSSTAKPWGQGQKKLKAEAVPGGRIPSCRDLSLSKLRDEMLSMGAQGWTGDAQSLLLWLMVAHPSRAFWDLILVLEGEASSLKKKNPASGSGRIVKSSSILNWNGCMRSRVQLPNRKKKKMKGKKKKEKEKEEKEKRGRKRKSR